MQKVFQQTNKQKQKPDQNRKLFSFLPCVNWLQATHFISRWGPGWNYLKSAIYFFMFLATVYRHKAEKSLSSEIASSLLTLMCSWTCLPHSGFALCPRLWSRRYWHKLFAEVCTAVLQAFSAAHSGEELLCNQGPTEGQKSGKLNLVAGVYHAENCLSFFSSTVLLTKIAQTACPSIVI